MDTVRESKLMITNGEQPFRFLTIIFDRESQVSFTAWNTGSECSITRPSDNDLRTIIAACQSGLEKEL